MGGAILLGLLTGLNVSVIGMGIVLIFKTGKYINFAQAQLGVVPMLIMGKLGLTWGWNWYVSFAAALVIGAFIALVCEMLVIRPLAKLGPQPVLVGTIGIAQVLLGLAYVKQLSAGQVDLISNGYPVPFDTRFKLFGATFFAQHVLTIIAVPAVALALWLFLSRTLTGKSIRATACNEQAALLAGLNTRRLSRVAWAVAGCMATVGAVLAAPNSPGFEPASVGPSLMFTALGAAALAGFSSFVQVVVAGALMGIVQAVVVYETSNTSRGVLALFLLTLVGLIARRKSDALREAAGSMRSILIRPGMTPAERATRHGRIGTIVFPVVLSIIGLICVMKFHDDHVNLFRFEQIFLVCAVAACVSLLGGLTGQMNLGQAAFWGLGAAMTAKMIGEGSSSLLVNGLVSAVVVAVVSIVVALPSLRGGSLMPAVTTLGFGVLASSWLFQQTWLNKGGSGFGGEQAVDAQKLPFLGAIDTGYSVALMVLVGSVLLIVVATRLQRSALGVRMSAVRFSDEGARSIGLNVVLLRIGGVALIGALTGAIGAFDVSANDSFVPANFNPQVSLVILSLAVIGGLGSVTGAAMAAVLIYGLPLFLSDWIQSWGGNPVQVQLFLGGAGLVVNLILNPGGLASGGAEIFHRIFGRRSSRAEVTASPVVFQPAESTRVPDRSGAVLRTHSVSKSFGVVQALRDVSIEVGKHEIVGLIGNNGAGKTTLLNCIAGDFQYEGNVELFDRSANGASTTGRSRAGLGRTFQDARLFAGLTTLEVLHVAAGRRTDSVDEATAEAKQSDAERAEEVLADLSLERYRNVLTADLPTGVKRMVELGIQLARRPGLILLDEPAAGLSQAEVRLFGPRLRELVDRLGCSVLMIEHDLPLMLSIADRIYCLELGQLIAEGTPTEIRNNPAVVESYFGSPTGVGARRSGEAVSPDQHFDTTQLVIN